MFMDHPTLEASGSNLLDRIDLPVLFHEGDWLGYKAMAFLVPDLDYGLILLMNSNDPTVTSALRFLAWNVTLIATGGEAQYFPPAESFLVRNSRLFFPSPSSSCRVVWPGHQACSEKAAEERLSPGRVPSCTCC